MGEMRDRRLQGRPYRAGDPEDVAGYDRTQDLLERYDAAPSASRGDAERAALLRELLVEVGEDVVVRPPFFCEFGDVRIGAGTFANVGLLVLDVAPVTIGARCQIGPRVQLLAATHPLDVASRREEWESAAPVTIDDDVWLGAGTIVCPGVTIGAGTVVAAGAVVTRDLPGGVLAAGVPARVVREGLDVDETAAG
ncbi:sugar O-acetyltransferase [Patulibacter brassicae]|uniref:Sugar O-acetyltransferase n=1 Tax=Patulibacter brassicae TaxID=1705717 RepID=A0ABU4VPS1_9ACTN|nr:sugar O-acetyltransferase [Patulibacter brassicae]MDX8153332.1 sugar O-acetyltransferase [Patulibacter brassicae]